MSGERLEEALNEETGFFIRARMRLADFHSSFQHVQVYETTAYGRLFRLDGCNMTSERDEFFYHENIVHATALSHSAPKQVLIIGGGDGGSSEEILKHPSIEGVTLVELDQAVIDIAAQFFESIHHGVFDDARLRLIVADGLAYIHTTERRYDLIILDLPDPVGPAAELYRQAFFRRCRAILNPGGALSLHVGSPIAHPERFTETLASLRQTFAIVRPYTVYVPLYGSLWGMAVAADDLDPVALPAAEVDARIRTRGLADLQYYNGDTHHAMFALPNYIRRMLG